jgi:hypothetical protein
VKKLPKLGELVVVRWNDSAGTSKWGDGDAVTPCTNESVGWLTGKHRGHINLAASHSDGDDSWGERLAIPRCNVEMVKRIRVRRRKGKR